MEGEAFTAWDLLDIVNPLQHIPLVSDAYRAITGDTIRPEIQLAGSTVVGGVLGFAGQLGKMVFEAGTGQSVGDAVMTALVDTPTHQPSTAAVARVEPVEVASLPASIIAQHHAPTAQNNYPSVSQAFAAQTAYDAYQRVHEAPAHRSNQIL